MFLTKTYSIEDCTYYNPNTITSITTVNISLPSNVEVSFKVKRTSDSNNYSYLEIGGNSGNTALMGQVGGAGYSQFRTYASEGSSTIDATHDTSNVPSNTETLLVWTKNGTSQSYSTGSSTVTWSDNHTHSKIKKLTILNNRVQELKVKPL